MKARGNALPRAAGYRFPAEWEPHAATWMAWPAAARDWPTRSGAIPWVLAEIARVLTRTERVRFLVGSAGIERAARRTLGLAGADLRRVDFFRGRSNRTWTRDILPIFLVKRRGAGLAGVKWRFNGWARWTGFALDDAVGDLVARRTCDRIWRPRATVRGRTRGVVLEGGAVETDGQGTLMLTEECLLGARCRNPGLPREALERVLLDYLACERVLWLGRGLQGDDTTGHVDTLARFVGPGRIVLCREGNRRDPNHRSLAENAERLQGARDARGRALEVIPLPMPTPVHHGRQRLPATYANFLVANGQVLVPTYDDPADRHALGLLAEIFPDREVVGIHSRDLVLGGGTVHCTTFQEPAAGRR